MGRSLDADLAYGYNLEDPDTVRIREVGEWGTPTVDWYDPDGDESFVDALMRRLYEQVPDADPVEYDWQRADVVKKRLGVWWVTCGTEESTGHILVAGEGPSAYYGTTPLDLAELAEAPVRGGWDEKLAAALVVLGITPHPGGSALAHVPVVRLMGADMTAALRFELVCEAIAPDGTRTRIGAFPIPACCLICGGRVYDDTYRMWASIATVNNQTGLVCPNHGGGR